MSPPWLQKRGLETWFFEHPVGASTFGLKVDKLLHEDYSGDQHILIFENSHFGRVLTLDGLIQVTEADEHIYHEMMVHPALLSHGSPKNVLIIGGGDGGILREVLRHDTIKRATMVELDASVVELSKKWLPSISNGAFQDPRTELIIADGAEFMQSETSAFDVIIVDSTDPTGPGAILFSDTFYKACRNRLPPNGLLVTQNGIPFIQGHASQTPRERLKKHFGETTTLDVTIPSYVGGALVIGVSGSQIRKMTEIELTAGVKCINGAMRYYTPRRHLGLISHN